MLQISYEDVANVNEGDVILLQSKRYKLLKKRTTAVAVRRQYFWDDIWEKVLRYAKKETNKIRPVE